MGPSNVKLIASLFASSFRSRSIRVLFCSIPTTTHFRFTRLEPGWNAYGTRHVDWNADGTPMERGLDQDFTNEGPMSYHLNVRQD